MTRQELYDLVWSAPMAAVAEQLGISDKSVTKRCQAHGIPTPPRGYWTQVAIDRAGPKPPLEGDAGEPITTAQDLAASRARNKASGVTTGAQSRDTKPHERATMEAQIVDIDTATLRALAAELHTHDSMTALVDRVATRALTLPAAQARPALQWAATMRAALERQDPAATVLRFLEAI